MSTNSLSRAKLPKKPSDISKHSLPRFGRIVRKARATRASNKGALLAEATKAAFSDSSFYERVVDILGVDHHGDHSVDTLLDVHALVGRGLPRESLAIFIAGFDRIKPVDLYAALGISGRTVQRHAASTNKSLSADNSGRLWDLAEVKALATSVFGGQPEAEQWLDRPALALNGSRPIELMKTIQGSKAVKDLLARIEHGVYT